MKTAYWDVRFHLSATLGALGLAGLALAQAPGALSEQDFLAEMPIVLSVSRLPQRLDETPGALSIIDREMIRRSGARDVADLLRLLPGFQVSSAFETLAPLASYHGAFDSYSNRLQLLIDGRSVYSPYFIGSIGSGLQSLALQDIERIEVLRGSNSAAYGARAFLAVINIVTRHTLDTLGLQATLSAGENALRDAQASLGWGDAQRSNRLSVDSRADAGLAGSQGANLVRRVNWRTDWRLNAYDELQLRFGALSIDAGKGFVGNVDDLARRAKLATGYVQFDWRRNLGVDHDLALSLSHNQESYDDKFPYSLARFGIADDYLVDGSGSASSDSLTLQNTWCHSAALRSVWGAELHSERVQSKALYNTDSVFVNDFSRLFGNAEWHVQPALVLNAGAMAEHSSVSGTTLAPRFMLNWHLSAGQTLRAGVSRAFRPPSNFEKFANYRYIWNGIELGQNTVASGAVQAESIVTHEVGYLASFAAAAMRLDARLFHEQINGFIRQMNATLPRDYVNAEDFAIQGLEYQLKWQPWRSTEVFFSQSYTDIDSRDPGSSFAAPKLASSLTALVKLPNQFDLTFSQSMQGIATLAGSGFENRLAQTRTDLRLAKALHWGAQRAELALVLQNLGAAYADFDPSFRFERRAFVVLRLDP